MDILFRADASHPMGTGHIMRCLTLAEALKERGARPGFLCKRLPGNLIGYLQAREYEVLVLPEDQGDSADEEGLVVTALLQSKLASSLKWLVVDHYQLDQGFERVVKPFAEKMMVIDDLANRPHDCDVLLDQNYYLNGEMRYEGLIPLNCHKLLGPQYALLRSEFFETRKNLKERSGEIGKILVCFGGSDLTNETGKTLKALKSLNLKDRMVTVVIGATNPHRSIIKTMCDASANFELKVQVNNMAALMSEADLAIGAGGSTHWERCFLGLPSLIIMVAANQIETTTALATSGALWNLGMYDQVTEATIAERVLSAMNDPKRINEMGNAAQRIMGNLPDRLLVAEAMMEV